MSLRVDFLASFPLRVVHFSSIEESSFLPSFLDLLIISKSILSFFGRALFKRFLLSFSMNEKKKKIEIVENKINYV